MTTAPPAHVPMPLLRVIRAKCVDCSGGSHAEVKECPVVRCPLHPYRMGTNPFRAKRRISEAQRARSLVALRAAHAVRAASPTKSSGKKRARIEPGTSGPDSATGL